MSRRFTSHIPIQRWGEYWPKVAFGMSTKSPSNEQGNLVHNSALLLYSQGEYVANRSNAAIYRPVNGTCRVLRGLVRGGSTG